MTQPLRAFEDTGKKRIGNNGGGVPQKYFLSDQQRNLLLREYDGRTETINRLMKHFPGVPRERVREWAADLGLARHKKPVWTEQEIHYLEVNLHKMPLRNIAKKLGRSKSAVTVKSQRLGINKTQEGYTMKSLCLGLGCGQHKLKSWIDRGWLKGTLRKSERRDDIWYFSDQNVRDFVKNHPEEIDLRRVDALWFLDVLTGGTHGIGELAL